MTPVTNWREPPARVLVIGTGLLGTSVGLALTAAGAGVWLSDPDAQAVDVAVAMGAGQPADAADGPPDLVVVAVPPSVTARVVAEALHMYPDATVTDVASVKAPIIAGLRDVGADLSRFVGGHPMAGREVHGPRAGRADLFDGRPWILTPDAAADPERVQVVAGMVAATGAVMRVLPPEVHDHAVALTSHTPQLVASLMAARLAGADDALVSVSGQGLRDVVRIAASDPGLWSDILITNAAAVVPVLQELQQDLSGVTAALSQALPTGKPSADDWSPADSPTQPPGPGPERGGGVVAAVLTRGNTGAGRLPAKHGGEATDYVTVPVVVADEPGSLGRLFLAAGGAGINLEDVRIEHTVGRLTAIAHLSVLPGAGTELRSALERGGWRVTG